jgi:predicted nucleic acid-binding protein
VEEGPEDDQFIECAVALKAKFVITGDRAVRKIQDYMNIKMVSPREFLSSFRKSQYAAAAGNELLRLILSLLGE